MQIIIGDLVKLTQSGHFDVLVHGCNCFCAMGAGIAKQIRTVFPEAFEADFKTKKGDVDKLGTYSLAKVTKESHTCYIVNAYTQYHYSGQGVLVDYKAVRKVFSRIQKDFKNLRIGYPRIGAGLAGGDWEIISAIIDHELYHLDHTLVEFG